MAHLPEAIEEEENEFSEGSQSHENYHEKSVSIWEELDSQDNLVHHWNIYEEEEKNIPFTSRHQEPKLYQKQYSIKSN